MDRCMRRFFLNSFMIFLAMALIPLTAVDSQAELRSLSDSELSGVYAEGFSDFTIGDFDGDGFIETKAWFNIYVYTYTTIDSLKLGYYDNSGLAGVPVGTGGTGWDQDWTNVVIGQSIDDPDSDFKAEGVYFKAEFDNIDNPATRQLLSIAFGASSITGDISAELNSFTGTINGTDYIRQNLGSSTITSIDSPFEISLSLTNGYWVNFGAGSTLGPRLYNMP